VLRTVFAGEAGSLEQVVLPVTPIELPVSGIAAEDAVRETIAEFRKRFDLARGPMLRARLAGVCPPGLPRHSRPEYNGDFRKPESLLPLH